MKNYYVHGTTIENLEKIKKEGFSDIRDTTWNCSNTDYIYLRKLNFDENNDAEEWFFDTIQYCLDNAQITASLNQSIYHKLAVLFFEIDDTDIEEDNSCENMNNCYQISVEEINKLKYDALIFEESYNPDFRYFYMPFDNDLLDITYAKNIDYNLMKVIKNTDRSEIFDCLWENTIFSIEEKEYAIKSICKVNELEYI